MSRHKENLSEDEVWLDCAKATKKIKGSVDAKIGKKITERDRSVFLLNLIEFNMMLENHRRNKRNSVFIAKGKNVLQSLSYLILNEVFYEELVLLRGETDIPEKGFDFQKEKGNVKYKREQAYEKTENLVKKYKLCNKNDTPMLTKILFFFLVYRMDFDSFFQMMAPMILEREREPILEGLDTKVVEYKNSQYNFFTCKWNYNLFLFSKLTSLEELFVDFLCRELVVETNKKSYDHQYVRFLTKKFNISKEQVKKKEKLNLEDKTNYLLFTFTTTFYTKPKDIRRLYKEKYNEIKEWKEGKEKHLKIIQKKYLSEEFEKNQLIARLRKRGLTYDEVSAYMHDDNKSLGDNYRGRVKIEWAEFKENVNDALKRKIIF